MFKKCKEKFSVDSVHRKNIQEKFITSSLFEISTKGCKDSGFMLDAI